MGSIGYRKKGDNGPLYCPERDYAYITPTLMRMAIENLDSQQTPLAAWREEHAITSAELVKIAETLADAQRDFVNAVDPVSSFSQALRRHGFYDFRPCVQQLLFASMGEIFCAAWFQAVREVSVVGEESPVSEDMARFTATVREFAVHHKQPWYDAHYMAEHLRMLNDVLQARINELGRQCAVLHADLVSAKQAVVAVAQKPATLWSRVCGSFHKLFKRQVCRSTGCTKTPRSSGPS
jgi:hypothetical protein